MLPAGGRSGGQMETRPAYFRSTLHLLRRLHGASRFARCRTEKTRQPVQSQKTQRPSNLLRQPAREIRARDPSRNDGFPAVGLVVTAGKPSLLALRNGHIAVL